MESGCRQLDTAFIFVVLSCASASQVLHRRPLLVDLALLVGLVLLMGLALLVGLAQYRCSLQVGYREMREYQYIQFPVTTQ